MSVKAKDAAANVSSISSILNVTTLNDISTGVFESKDNELTLYPNPVDNNLFLKMKSIGTAQITISDLNGRILKSIEEIISPDSKISIDLNSFESGIYLVKVRTNFNVLTGRFLKK
jgi:hypothetical protein